MKIGTITTTNQKGQVVIPMPIRQKLGISHLVPLEITLRGNTIHILPIKEIITTENISSYAAVLKKTQGSWKSAPDHIKSKRRLELSASKDRKQPW